MGEEQKCRWDAVIVEGLLFSFVLLLCLGSAELEAAENSVRSIVSEKGRAMFWRNFKRRGRKRCSYDAFYYVLGHRDPDMLLLLLFLFWFIK